MLIDKTSGLLETATKYANANGLKENLEQNLNSLKRHAENGCEVHLYEDFAPLSFYFEVIKNGHLQLCGVLIYHGKHDGGGNGCAPTYSVSLSPCQGWQIHT